MNGYSKHIVFILQRLQAGGAERQVSYLAHYLQEKSCKVTVVYFGLKEQKTARWFEEQNIRLLPIGFNEKQLLKPDRTIKGRIRKLRLLLKIIVFFRKLKPDALLPFTYEPNILIGRYWKYTGAQCCFWNQRDVGLYFSGSGFEKKALWNCTHWVANSPASAAFLQKQGIETISVIPNAVPVMAKRMALKNDSIRVLMIGNLHVNKDHLTLLKAWQIVLSKAQEIDLQLLLAGGTGNGEASVRDFLKDEQLEGSVQLLGVVSDIQELIASVSIGVLSSKAEGLPNAVLECMAGGLPVVATDNEGCRFALGDDYPFLSGIGDAAAMAEQLLKFIHSPELRIHWGQRNQVRIVQHFSADKMGAAFCTLIEQIG